MSFKRRLIFNAAVLFSSVVFCLSVSRNLEASETFEQYDFVFGPTFSAGEERNYGLSAAVLKRGRYEWTLIYGASLSAYMQAHPYSTADVIIGLNAMELAQTFVGIGARNLPRGKMVSQLSLGASFGYVSATVRRYSSKGHPVTEGVISVTIPVRLFL